jgi:hypothetical protein
VRSQYQIIRTVDVREALESNASRRPFDAECVAGESARVKLAFSYERDDGLATALADFSQRLQRPNRRSGAKFLGKLASCCLFWITTSVHFVIRPGAVRAGGAERLDLTSYWSIRSSKNGSSVARHEGRRAVTASCEPLNRHIAIFYIPDVKMTH